VRWVEVEAKAEGEVLSGGGRFETVAEIIGREEPGAGKCERKWFCFRRIFVESLLFL
jgi:hypothetical protein